MFSTLLKEYFLTDSGPVDIIVLSINIQSLFSGILTGEPGVDMKPCILVRVLV